MKLNVRIREGKCISWKMCNHCSGDKNKMLQKIFTFRIVHTVRDFALKIKIGTCNRINEYDLMHRKKVFKNSYDLVEFVYQKSRKQ